MTVRANPGSTVAVLGASPNEERYSFKAVQMLKEYGHKPLPVHPSGHVVDGIVSLKSLDDIHQDIDTLTVYVNAKVSGSAGESILRLKPRRVIFNPGAENPELAAELNKAGIETIQACTLVMLRTEQF
ncbi:MAG TPA: CoA-binding protein [candidate division Zixibacteria bacterium]|nr:CoA-binding protein [candidate division Zixibacteria bacterium]